MLRTLFCGVLSFFPPQQRLLAIHPGYFLLGFMSLRWPLNSPRFRQSLIWMAGWLRSGWLSGLDVLAGGLSWQLHWFWRVLGLARQVRASAWFGPCGSLAARTDRPLTNLHWLIIVCTLIHKIFKSVLIVIGAYTQ